VAPRSFAIAADSLAMRDVAITIASPARDREQRERHARGGRARRDL
jgi:hypothetical protein